MSDFKRFVMLDPFQPQEVELYFPNSAIRGKIGSTLPDAIASLDLLMQYVNGAIIQHARINQGQQLSNRSLLLNSIHKPEGQAYWDSWLCRLQSEFLDIHYYAICLDKIEKLYRQVMELVAPLARNAASPSEIRSKRLRAENQLREAIQPAAEARDYLEHINEKIATSNYDGLRTESNDTSFRLTYGKGEEQVTVDMGNIVRLKQAYEALIDYLATLPGAA
jgi:hypothetical protein